jgi:hypothetical protein
MIGCPILRALGEGWDATALDPKPFPAHSAYPTLRKSAKGGAPDHWSEYC